MNLITSLPSPGPWERRGASYYDRNGQCIIELLGPVGIVAANAELLEEAIAALCEKRAAEMERRAA